MITVTNREINSIILFYLVLVGVVAVVAVAGVVAVICVKLGALSY